MLWTAGDRVLRFPVWVVRERPSRFIDDVRRALVAAGWPGDRGKFGLVICPETCVKGKSRDMCHVLVDHWLG